MEYPITLSEISQTLRDLAEQLDQKESEEEACGDMRAYLVRKAAEIIAQLNHMVAHAPDRLPVRPDNPNDFQIEDHGAALTDFSYREMVRLTLTNPAPNNPPNLEYKPQYNVDSTEICGILNPSEVAI